MLLFAAELGSSKLLHIIIFTYLLLLKLIVESVALFLWYECQVRKLPKTGPFNIYVGATRAKIFLLFVISRNQKLKISWREN